MAQQQRMQTPRSRAVRRSWPPDTTRRPGHVRAGHRRVRHALANPDLDIHHGALLTCVYRPQTAACRDEDDNTAGGGPAWPRCRPSCRNIARTDRDIAELRQHVGGLTADLAAPGLPDPLRRRIRQRLHEHERAIAEHQNGGVQPHTVITPGSAS